MLRLRLIGGVSAEGDGRGIAAPASPRAGALLAWLALHPGVHDRATLAAGFWRDVLDSSARASLRSAVWALRRALGPDGTIVVAGRERLGLDPEAAVWVDTRAFDAPVDGGRARAHRPAGPGE